MNHFTFLAALVAAGVAGPAGAQSSMVNDVIAQTISGMNQGTPAACYTDRWAPKPKGIAKGTERSEAGIATYLKIAAAGTDLSEAYTYAQEERLWSLDGVGQDSRAARDPWASRVARLERVDLRVGNGEVSYRGLWRAVAADGTLLGTYDALLIRKKGESRLRHLALVSPGNASQPQATGLFCYEPGDIEKREQDIAERKAEKVARRAARDAGR